MTVTTKWHTRGCCPKCGWHQECKFGDTFHMFGLSCCPECGHKKDKFYDDWIVKTMRYEPNYLYKWWNPKTWGQPEGKWVVKDKE